MLRALIIAILTTACSSEADRPSEQAQAITRDGFIGITYLWRGGAEVHSVYPETPAERAGLRAGDVILKFNWRQPETGTDLQRFIIASPIGSIATLEVLRDGEVRAVLIRVTTWPTQLENGGPSFARTELDRRRVPDEDVDR